MRQRLPAVSWRIVFPLILGTLSILVALMPVALASSPQQMAMKNMNMAVTGTFPPDPSTCSPNVIPTGQSNPPGSESEPMAPIWCFPLAAPGSLTRVSGSNDWVDTFTGVTPMGRFSDGDYDYHVYGSVQNANIKSQHFTNNNHWMDDNLNGGQGGTMISPRRSFNFENGVLVVEQDVAAGVSGYAADAWPEITLSNQPAPTDMTWDNLYAYGQFGAPNSWTIGCRLQEPGGVTPICSVEAPMSQSATGNTANCNVAAPHRLMELSYFEPCGSVHSGGFPDGHFRSCDSAAQSPDMMCRDRFRMEIRKDGLRFFVNGALEFEDSGWPAAKQFNTAAGPWYVYAADWGDFQKPNTPYRFHWQRFAVNPHNSDGSIAAPSAAPSFCLGQPNNTCAMAATPTAVPNTPVPSTSTAVPPTSTTVPSVAPCRVKVSINGGPDEYRDQPNSFCGLP